MTVPPPFTRRDPRLALREGVAELHVPAVQFDDPPTVAVVTRISVAGLGFRIDRSRRDLETGMLVRGVRIRVGECEIEGDLAVRDVDDGAGSLLEIGGLFYPAGNETEGRLMALIAGIEAGRAS